MRKNFVALITGALVLSGSASFAASTPPLVGDEFDGGCMFPIPGSYILARIPALMLYAFCIFSQRKSN